jgi:DNA-binding MarR family transcriptional regulator/N-acetylglutamate synthase-like GNAT family acetyltransferase
MTATATLRHFNRTYTQRIGLLEESFLGGLGMPLAAARLVFEIGPTGTTVRELRDRLGLDSGYLSRLLRTLQDRGLVVVEPDPDDLRRRRVALTLKGRSTYRRLDDRSERLAEGILQPLSERQRDRLTAALATADLLVRAATVKLRRVDPRSELATRAVDEYFAELNRRFPNGFDAAAARASDAAAVSDGAAVFVVASSDGLPVGCGGVQQLTATTGEIKRMWVDSAWRGAGLGSRLLHYLEAVAVELGYQTIRLDTNGTLTDAIALYERAGYHRIARYNDNPYAQVWLERSLTIQPA